MRKHLAKVISFAMSLILSVTCLLPGLVRADSSMIISATCEVSNIARGDIITIKVMADNMPKIVSFGPIVLGYSSEVAEYMSFEAGSELTNFGFTETQEDGKIIISAVDTYSQPSDEEDEEYTYAPFESDSPVMLYEVSFRVRPDAIGEMSAWLEDLGEFRNSSDEGVEVIKGSGVTIPISEAPISADASLAFLKVRGVTLTPEFDPNITSYTASVERSVTEVSITATPSNLWAAVIIDGTNNLEIGENVINIQVTAQDGINHMNYTLHITRKESYVPDNASLVDGQGNTYTFVDLPNELSVPQGFTQTTRVINGYSVPCFTKEGVASVLLYLFDGSNSPGLYFYNGVEKSITKYDPNNTIIRMSKILKSTPLPDGVEIPTGYVPAEYKTESAVMTGYVNEDNQFICYLTDESGNGAFYLYNPEEQSFQMFTPQDKRAEVLYKYLLNIFIIVSLIESIIIVIIVYLVRRIFVDKTTPRPKRV
ncbi:MAG: cadherin-like beta sandwich domain-containing protein [Saccharofermentans sp.]|nr:cadherin-like beta sandwich domain-containing protein [Saccharofermentans sp.]